MIFTHVGKLLYISGHGFSLPPNFCKSCASAWRANLPFLLLYCPHSLGINLRLSPPLGDFPKHSRLLFCAHRTHKNFLKNLLPLPALHTISWAPRRQDPQSVFLTFHSGSAAKQTLEKNLLNKSMGQCHVGTRGTVMSRNL